MISPKYLHHFSLDSLCATHASGQSYVFFHQVWKSGQSGHVTRIASRCHDEASAKELQQVFDEQILTLPTAANRFHLHLTPDYSKTPLPGTDYKFFNKPFGLKHWMEEGLGFPENLPNYKDTIFIILDPDQILLRPFTTADFGLDPTTRWHQQATRLKKEYVVTEGRPLGQIYLFGADWVKDVNADVSRVVSAALKGNGISSADVDPNDKSSSHLHNWTAKEVYASYVAGPPYIAVASDMYPIVATWAAVVVPVYELTKNHLSEMYAYSTAAAHLQLPHQLAYSFMVSHPDVKDYEGWRVVDEMKPEQVCKHVSSDSAENWSLAGRSKLPHILHYCQRYALGPHVFFKYFIPDTLLTCGHPLLMDPTVEDDIVFKYNSSLTSHGQLIEMSPVRRQRHAFMICHGLAKINEVAAYWKKQHCKGGVANFDKVFSIAHLEQESGRK